MKLNLGGGRDIISGFKNVDCVKNEGVDIVHNLNKYPYPIKDNSVDEIIANNIIEHLDDPNLFIRELWRISQDGCKIEIIAPHSSSPSIWNDLTHRRGFGYGCLDHYDNDIKDKGHSLNNKSKVKFKVDKKIIFGRLHKIIGIRYIANRFPNFYECFMQYIFQSRAIRFRLEVVRAAYIKSR